LMILRTAGIVAILLKARTGQATNVQRGGLISYFYRIGVGESGYWSIGGECSYYADYNNRIGGVLQCTIKPINYINQQTSTR
jgi:hypothetical protein